LQINGLQSRRIELRFINEGGKNVAQAIFKPEEKLKPQEKYSLKIENLSKEEAKLFRDKKETPSWITRKSDNINLRNFDINLNYTGNEHQEWVADHQLMLYLN